MGAATLILALSLGGAEPGRASSSDTEAVRAPASKPFLLQAKIGDRSFLARCCSSGFGSSVALSADGQTAIVGAPSFASSKGAAWVLTRRGSAWDRVRLAPSKVRGSPKFGFSVAISGDGRVVLVGGQLDDGKQGAAWVFARTASGWVEEAKLTQGNDSLFGWSVALSGDGSLALVGGPDDDRGVLAPLKERLPFANVRGKGAVWSYARANGRWRLLGGRKLSPVDRAGRSAFGTSVALSADGLTAVVGGPNDGDGRGAAWIFTRSGTLWSQQGPKATGRRGFGTSVAISASGSTVLVGAPLVDSVQAFLRSGSSWRKHGSPLTGAGRFGTSVALSADGRTAVVGSPGALGERGSARVFRSVQGWMRHDELVGERRVGRGHAGTSAAIAADGHVVLMGGPGDDTGRGAAWVFFEHPVVEAVDPAVGPTTGGTEVVVGGRNFSGARSVLFGARTARFRLESPTRIVAIAPPGAGRVDVRVVTTHGISEITSVGRFTYLEQPVVTSLSPVSGPTAGGTTVTVSGSGFAGATAVRFGAVPAPSFRVESPTRISAVSPPGAAGTVDVTVAGPGGTSSPGDGARFTYGSPETVITFDDLATGGPGGAGALVPVTTQYASRGITFANASAIDYSRGPSALPGFARSGSIAIEPCVGVEFCTSPLRMTFAPARGLVRVWVGFSFTLAQPVTVELRALNSSGGVVGTATATLAARTGPTPIRTPLEVRVGGARISEVLVSIPGGFSNALAVDDVVLGGP